MIKIHVDKDSKERVITLPELCEIKFNGEWSRMVLTSTFIPSCACGSDLDVSNVIWCPNCEKSKSIIVTIGII